MIIRGACESVRVDDALVGRTSAITSHTANVLTLASALSVGTREDAQVILSPGWRRTSSGSYVTNSPKNGILVKVRDATIVKACIVKARYSTTNANGKQWIPQPGYVGKRYFTSTTSRGSFTDERPTIHGGNVGSIGFESLDGTDRYFEWQCNGPGDGQSATVAMESMRLPEDGGSEHGMWWELTGFVTNADAVFDLVSINEFPFEVLELGDSNDGGYVNATSGGSSYPFTQVRAGVASGATSAETFDPAGAEVQWLQLALRAYCAARGLSLDVLGNVHGGAWQGVMGSTTRTYIVDNIWPGCCQDLGDRWDHVFHGDTAFTSGSHWSGGTWRPKLITFGSFTNDFVRALIELLGTSGFPLDSGFRGTTHRDAVKALADELLTAFPEAKMVAHRGIYTDAANGSLVDTMAQTANAFTAGSPNGRGFQNDTTSGTEGTTGLFLPISNYNSTTGLSAVLDLGSVHWNQATHLAIKNAVYSVFSTWLDSALGIVFVNSTTGNDGNAGTFAAPKKTISGAGSSWTYLALSGTFAETITISAHGTQYAPKTVFRYGSTATVNAINTNSKNYVLVHGVTATASTGFTIATGSGIRLSHVTASGCSTAGAAISGGTVTVEHSTFTGCGIGLNLSGSATVTAKRNTYSSNTNGVKTAGTVTLTDDRSHIYESAGHGYHVTAGNVTLTNCKLASKVNAVGTFDTWGVVWVEGGQANIYNSLFAIVNATDFLSGGSIAYAIRAASTGRAQWKNCVFVANSNTYSTYVWVDATGASGNVVAATNNAYEDIGSTFKFAVGATLVEAAADPKTFTTWSALTDRTPTTLESGSANGATLVTADADSDIVDDKPATTSIANGIGANLSATFTTDYFRVTRAASGAWDAGPWIL